MRRLGWVVAATLCVAVQPGCGEGNPSDDLSAADLAMPAELDGATLDGSPDLTSPGTGDVDLAANAADLSLKMGLPGGPSSSRLSVRAVGTTASSQGFLEYLPPGYGDGAARPLLLFLHGIGEDGDGSAGSLGSLTNTGIPQLIQQDAWPESRTYVVLMPQNARGGCHTPDDIHAFFQFALSHYDIDPARVYATGLSCGAIGLWNYLGAYTNEYVAAAVPISGDGQGAWSAAQCGLGKVALWGLHGDMDPTVNVAGTTVPINNLLDQCPAPPRRETKLTIYPGDGHNVWQKTYDLSAGNDIYAWMNGFTH